MSKKKRLKIGLALGAGGAMGLAHIGVLKVLHEHKIYPDFLAGTSMGAVIAAGYAAGRTPDELEEFANTTNWKSIADFTIPKAGLLHGKKALDKIKELVYNKSFEKLNTKLRIVAYNLDLDEKVVFSKGNLARAVRASISIPGVFSPIKIDNHDYIDGAVTDPTPFDVVKEMGADIVIAVDLYSKEKIVEAPKLKEQSFYDELKEKFVAAELLNVRNYLIPSKWPEFARKILIWTFDKLLYPAKVIRILSGKEYPQIVKVMYDTFDVLCNNLARERLKNAKIDVIVTPKAGHLSWVDFNEISAFVKIGEKAMRQKLPQLKEKLGINY